MESPKIKDYRKYIHLSGIVFISSLIFFSSFFIVQYNISRRKITLIEKDICSHAINNIISNLNIYSNHIEHLQSELVLNDGTVDNFYISAELFSSYDNAIKSVTFYPENGESFIYEKEEGFGTIIKKENINSFSKKSQSLIGPVELNDSRVLIILNPFYTSKDQFWGFGLISVNIDYICTENFYELLSKYGFNIKLSIIDYSKRAFKIVYENHPEPLKNEKNYSFELLNQQWIMSIEYYEKVFKNQMQWTALTGICIILLITALSFYIQWMNDNKKILESLSFKDGLTALHNHRKYEQKLASLEKQKINYGILYMDLNDFKKINDTYGHKSGNLLLKIIANKIKNNIKDNDSVYRIGGDEFAVIVDGEKNTETYDIIKSRIEAAVEKTTVLENISIVPGISIGYARFPEDGETPDEIERKAEQKMYQEKIEKKSKIK